MTFQGVVAAEGLGSLLEVILLGTDQHLYWMHQVETGAWIWRGPLPNPQFSTFDMMATGVGSNGDLTLIVRRRTVDQDLVALHQPADGGPWSWDGNVPSAGSSVTLGRFTTAPGNGLQVVGSPSDGSTSLQNYYQSGSSWLWGGTLPSPPPGPFDAVASAVCFASCWPSNHTDVIALRALDGGQDAGLPCLFEQPWGQGQTWHSTNYGCLTNPDGETFRDITTGTGNQEQPQHILLTASTGRPYLYYMTTDFGWIASGYLPNPNQIGFAKVVAANGANNDLLVLGLGKVSPYYGKPYLIWQQASTGAWTWRGELPNPENRQFTAVAMARGNDNNIQVVLIGTDGLAYLIYQVNSSGNWYWAGRLLTP